MNKYYLKCIYAGVLLLAFACSSPKKTEETQAPEAKSESSEKAEMNGSSDAPKYGMIITHEVADFDKWLESYNEASGMRTGNGLNDGTVHRHSDNPNMVTVTLFTSGHESAKAFATSQDLKFAMQQAGVTSEPEVSYWDLKWLRPGSEEAEFKQAYLVNHDVSDVEAWQQLFEEHDSVRVANGSLAIVTATNSENPNNVGIYLGITDAEKSAVFLQNPELEEEMKKAGVIGAPTVTLLDVAQSAN
ncbi:MAG: hypothetical protein JXQ96_00820 [Cyclobacteriaceae bacterium]